MTTSCVAGDHSYALGGMRFLWPFGADVRVLYWDEADRTTSIGRQKRDYLWIMARRPQVSEDTLQRLIQVAADRGYDTSRIQRVPQRW